MNKDINKLIFRVNDENDWATLMEHSMTKLVGTFFQIFFQLSFKVPFHVVCDVHQDWCGLCEAIHPTIMRIFIDYDNAEGRLVYSSANIAKVGALIQSYLPSDSHIVLEKNGCIPIFALFRGKSCVSVISGVDGPLLLQQLSLNIPDKVSKEEQ